MIAYPCVRMERNSSSARPVVMLPAMHMGPFHPTICMDWRCDRIGRIHVGDELLVQGMRLADVPGILVLECRDQEVVWMARAQAQIGAALDRDQAGDRSAQRVDGRCHAVHLLRRCTALPGEHDSAKDHAAARLDSALPSSDCSVPARAAVCDGGMMAAT